jgi:hypothetical protein
MVPGRTQVQRVAGDGVTVSNIDPTMTSVGNSTADEVKKLMKVVRAHGARSEGQLPRLSQVELIEKAVTR